jgi:uncharacterized cofD-like protein
MSAWPRVHGAAAPRLAGTGESRLPRVVALGGGTGLPILLEGLGSWLCPEEAGAPDLDQITAIVSMADDGGSSGRLRRAFDVPPPGDLRNCLLALSSQSSDLRDLFAYRFDGHQDVGGHSLGNLILTALSRMEPGLTGALDRASLLLGVRGRVIPSTLDRISLRAVFDDGTSIEGESAIATARRPIRRLVLEPADARPHPGALRAIEQAGLILISPGSLYTSLLPVLMVPGIAEAMLRADARVALVCNLLTEPGETDGFSAADFVMAIRSHVPELRLDDVLLHDGAVDVPEGSSAAVRVDMEPLRFLGVRPVLRDIAEAGPSPRHDAVRLGRAVMDLVMHAPCRVRRP